MAQHWEIVGGEASGGIQVRKAEDLNSGVENDKLSFGAVVKQLELNDKTGRLKFAIVKGTGPAIGWISTALKSGKVLCVKTEAPAEGAQAEASAATQAENQPPAHTSGGYLPANIATLVDTQGQHQPRQYEHPILIIGAGLGGCKTAIDLLQSGRKNLIILDTHEDFGGTTWLEAANPTTKLQTEKGTYHLNYMDPNAIPDPFMETWPRREQIRNMFSQTAKDHGLKALTRFESHLDLVTVQGDTLDKGYYEATVEDFASSKTYKLKVSAVLSWPGNFHEFNEITFPGEKQFGGYITYGSFDLCNYDKCKGQVCTIYGHGGFTIENVRTLLEREAKKIWIVCRRRSIVGMKMASWLVSSFEVPVPGHNLVKIMQKMYDVIGVDLWSHYAVKSNKEHSYALITQGNTFGVNDVYFLAEAYGLMEVREDNIVKLGPGCIYLENTPAIETSVIVKCIGIHANPDFDRIAGVNEMTGLWVNGDPLRSVCCAAHGVKATNYGGFSSGPGYAGMIKAVNYFVDFPEDFSQVVGNLPKNKAKGDKPAYYPDSFFVLTSMAMLYILPELARRMAECDAIKAAKTKSMHPLDDFLAQCKSEWEAYDKMMRAHGQIPDDAAQVPYPYTKELVMSLVNETVEGLKQK